MNWSTYLVARMSGRAHCRPDPTFDPKTGAWYPRVILYAGWPIGLGREWSSAVWRWFIATRMSAA